jgi:hypothetical protein
MRAINAAYDLLKNGAPDRWDDMFSGMADILRKQGAS